MAEAVGEPRTAWPVGDGARSARSRVHLLSLLIPAALVLLALALRFHDLAGEPLWLDEGYTLLFSSLPLDRLITIGGAHEHPPLYYTLVHAGLALRNSYLVPRYISSFAGAASVVALYALGAHLFNRLAGAVAAVLLALSPFHVWYSQDGRGYELAGLLVVLSYLALFHALDWPRRRTWVLYAACLALTLYTEYTTIFVILPQVLLALRARERGLLRPMLLSWAGVALAFAPWIGMLLTDARSIGSDYWIPMPNGTEVANTVLEFLGMLTPCPNSPCTGSEVGLPFLAGHEGIVALAVALTAGMVGIVAALRRKLTISVLAAWLIVPFAVVLALALRRSLYLDREFLDATFPLYLLVGLGVSRPARRTMTGLGALLVFLVVVGSSLAALRPVYAGGMNPDWRTAAHDFGAAYRPGAAVVFNPGVARTLVAAYLPAGWHATYERPLWSLSYLDVPGWQHRFRTVPNPNKRQREIEEATIRSAQLAAAARGHTWVWLVTWDYPGMNDSRRWFVEHGFRNELSELYGGDTRIELWGRRPPSALGPAVVPNHGFAGWERHGTVRVAGGVAAVSGRASLAHAFVTVPGTAYSVDVQYRGVPLAAKPLVTLAVYDRRGRRLATFPRTQWYDWPVNDVWLDQPFGFVDPPGGVRAVLSLYSAWGKAYWRNVAVYRERAQL